MDPCNDLVFYVDCNQGIENVINDVVQAKENLDLGNCEEINRIPSPRVFPSEHFRDVVVQLMNCKQELPKEAYVASCCQNPLPRPFVYSQDKIIDRNGRTLYSSGEGVDPSEVIRVSDTDEIELSELEYHKRNQLRNIRHSSESPNHDRTQHDAIRKHKRNTRERKQERALMEGNRRKGQAVGEKLAHRGIGNSRYGKTRIHQKFLSPNTQRKLEASSNIRKVGMSQVKHPSPGQVFESSSKPGRLAEVSIERKTKPINTKSSMKHVRRHPSVEKSGQMPPHYRKEARLSEKSRFHKTVRAGRTDVEDFADIESSTEYDEDENDAYSSMVLPKKYKKHPSKSKRGEFLPPDTSEAIRGRKNEEIDPSEAGNYEKRKRRVNIRHASQNAHHGSGQSDEIWQSQKTTSNRKLTGGHALLEAHRSQQIDEKSSKRGAAAISGSGDTKIRSNIVSPNTKRRLEASSNSHKVMKPKPQVKRLSPSPVITSSTKAARLLQASNETKAKLLKNKLPMKYFKLPQIVQKSSEIPSNHKNAGGNSKQACNQNIKSGRTDAGDFADIESTTEYDGDENTAYSSWELATNYIKHPLKSMRGVIPPPSVLLSYIKKRFPVETWPSGIPTGIRFFPNGKPFAKTFANGSTQVFYPHGGLAMLISSPQPNHQVLLFRDPMEGFYFLDKSLLAGFSTIGIGAVYNNAGEMQLRYDQLGGYRRIGSTGYRWIWHKGGHRILHKLNPYMSLRISGLDSIHVQFYGYNRGMHFNIGRNFRLPIHLVSTSQLCPPKFLHEDASAITTGFFECSKRQSVEDDICCCLEQSYSNPCCPFPVCCCSYDSNLNF